MYDDHQQNAHATIASSSPPLERDEHHLLDAHHDQDATKEEKSRSLIYCGVLMIVIGLLITIIVLASENDKLSNKLSKQEATQSINQVIIEIINTGNLSSLNSSNETSSGIYNLTSNENNTIYESFIAFDEDDDGMWSINEHFDYILYTTETAGGRTNYSSFDVADIDNDDVISFRELVYITTLLNESYDTLSLMTKNYLNNYLIPAAVAEYDLKELYYGYGNYSGITNDNNFNIFEYVSALLMDRYDENGNGYVTFENYISLISNESFSTFDLNFDNLISFNEYVEASFSINGLTFFSSLTEAALGINITLESFIISDIINLNVDKESFLSNNNYNDGNYYKLYQCPNMKLLNQSYGLNSYYDIYNGNSNSYGNYRRRLAPSGVSNRCEKCWGPANCRESAKDLDEDDKNNCYQICDNSCYWCADNWLNFDCDPGIYWYCMQERSAGGCHQFTWSCWYKNWCKKYDYIK